MIRIDLSKIWAAGLFLALLVGSCAQIDEGHSEISRLSAILPPSTVSMFHQWRAEECLESQVWILGPDWPSRSGRVISIQGCVSSSGLDQKLPALLSGQHPYDEGKVEAVFDTQGVTIRALSQELIRLESGEERTFSWVPSNAIEFGRARLACRPASFADEGVFEAFQTAPTRVKLEYVFIECSGKALSHSRSAVQLIQLASEGRGYEGYSLFLQPQRGTPFSDSPESGVRRFRAMLLKVRSTNLEPESGT